MAEENKNLVPVPIEPATGDEAKEQAEKKSAETRAMRDVPVETVPDAKLAPELEAVKEAETPEAREARRQAEDALNKPVEAIEDAVNRFDAETKPEVTHTPPAVAAAHADQTVLFGRVLPYPVYTVVFAILAALTIFEVIVAELPDGFLRAPLLVVASLIKAILVVLFYMHLREDSRTFALALIIPVFITIVAALFLLAVPPTGY